MILYLFRTGADDNDPLFFPNMASLRTHVRAVGKTFHENGIAAQMYLTPNVWTVMQLANCNAVNAKLRVRKAWTITPRGALVPCSEEDREYEFPGGELTSVVRPERSKR